jgi:dihydrofolate synthase / folylpolyglutamate synthase
MNFEESLDYLLSLGHETLAMKLGLRNTELLLANLDHPQKSYQSVQIAGTNGKGSTAVVLDSICRAAQIRTGLFTSPHLVSITERIVIDGAQIAPDDFARLATTVRVAAEKLRDKGQLPALPTFFEHVTAIALLAFKEARVKLAILETGLGGRLDATTVAGAGTVAITSLGLDHQEYLGETLAEIAAEKAAIIYPGATAVIAPQPPEAMAVINKRCDEKGVSPVIVNEGQASVHEPAGAGRFTVTFTTPAGCYQNVLVGLRGRHQIINSLVALQLAESLRNRGFEVPNEAIVKGIETARHAGRLELHEGTPPLLLDGAHNSPGAATLVQYLEEFVKEPVTLIFGAMRDKRLEDVAAVLFPAVDRVVLTRPENLRAASLEDLGKLASRFFAPEKIHFADSSLEALQAAWKVTKPDGLICVTGSLYLVGEIKRIHEIAPSSRGEQNVI